MKKKRHEEHENHERWLVSYADFITLLFAFFVVLYATSNQNQEKEELTYDSEIIIDNAKKLTNKANLIFDNCMNIYTIKLYELIFELYIKESKFKDALLIAKSYLLNIYKY